MNQEISHGMQGPPRVVAHMIVGQRYEPFLADALASIAGACDHAVINDNSGAASGPNDEAIFASEFARSGRLTHLRTQFVDFSTARNACIDATPDTFRNGWALYADADEVHGADLPAMAQLLARVPDDVDTLDGYSRNFIGSFSFWYTFHRRLRFFRLNPARRWHGLVHERLEPLGKRDALPVIGMHYGHVCPPDAEMDRERLYQSLGQLNTLAERAASERVTPALVWGENLRDALRFQGHHPAVAEATIARLSAKWAATFAQVEGIVASQSLADRIRNRLRLANYVRVLLFRSVEARWRWGYPSQAVAAL